MTDTPPHPSHQQPQHFLDAAALKAARRTAAAALKAVRTAANEEDPPPPPPSSSPENCRGFGRNKCDGTDTTRLVYLWARKRDKNPWRCKYCHYKGHGWEWPPEEEEDDEELISV